MIRSVKKLLYKMLSQQAYLKALHRGFYTLYRMGRLKGKAAFKYHYLVADIVREDDTVVDIGANLGYFAVNFAKLTPRGKVFCIEPVPPFYAILKWALAKYPNAEAVNCALGTEKGTVKMVLPQTDGMIRTGLPHIASEAEKNTEETIDVPLEKGSELLGKLHKIDYIKCDIEGFEAVVFPEIAGILADKKPIVQIEIGPENEAVMLKLFTDLGYVQYGVANFKVVRESGAQKEQGDFLFVHADQTESFETRMRGKGKMD